MVEDEREESKHTAMVFDKKYQDIETGKFATDKLPTIASYSWADCMLEDDDFDKEKNEELYRLQVEDVARRIARENGYSEQAVERIVSRHMEARTSSCNVKVNNRSK